MFQISDVFLVSMEKLLVILMEHYPRLSPKLHYMCFLAMLKVCFSLAPKGAVFSGFLARIGKTAINNETKINHVTYIKGK